MKYFHPSHVPVRVRGHRARLHTLRPLFLLAFSGNYATFSLVRGDRGRDTDGKEENHANRIPCGSGDGHRVEVFLYLSGSTSQLTVEAKGKVLRSDDRGIAVQFDEIDLDSFIHLRNIVALNEGDMDRIMQEFYQHLNENGPGAGR